MNQVVLRNVFYDKEVHTLLFQSWFMDLNLQNIPANGYEIKIYYKSSTDCAKG